MVQVASEIGRLRRVLVHEPGAEVDRMVPAMMEDLLFDDILFGDAAREEHGRFRRVLQILGVDVVDAEDLLAAALARGESRTWILDNALPGLPRSARERLLDLPPAALAEALGTGVLPERTAGAPLFTVDPLPNWCFQRDPQIVLGRGVAFASMATEARRREAILARTIFRFHPDLASVPVVHDPLDTGLADGSFGERALVEGGDVLVLSPEVVAIGHSERTNLAGIRDLAASLANREDGPRFLVVVDLPKRRAYMHLDTLVTQVDRDLALVYPPVLLDDGPERAHVFEVDLKAPKFRLDPREGFLATLARHGLDLEPIPCGGPDPIAQQREQWTDGANALAVAPGIVVLYDRNVATVDELSRRGFDVVTAEALLLGRAEVDLGAGRRSCILLSSHELSRARGGPHCLTHPLVRDAAN